MAWSHAPSRTLRKKSRRTTSKFRKQLLEYDDVMNKQREVIYQHRHAVLAGEHIQQDIHDMMKDLVRMPSVDTYCPVDQYQEEWDYNGLRKAYGDSSPSTSPKAKSSVADHFKDVGRDAMIDEIRAQVRQAYDQKEQELGVELMRYLEKMLLLQVIDHHWKSHLLGMDHLRDGIGLRDTDRRTVDRYKRRRVRHVLLMMGASSPMCWSACSALQTVRANNRLLHA